MPFRLRSRDKAELERLLRGGIQPVRVVLRSLVLLQLARDHPVARVAASVGLSEQAIRNIAQRYRTGRLARALYEQPRPGAAEILAASDKQRIIAMVCTPPPAGAARWTVRLIAEEAVKRKVVPHVGRETIRILLQSHDLKPWRETNVVHRRTDPGVPRQHGGRAGRL